MGEEVGFDDAGVIGEGEEFHGFAGDLVMDALLDDEAAEGDGLADVEVEAIDGAIGFPGDIGKEVEGMAGDGEAEEVGLGLEAFERGGFNDGEAREGRGIGRGEEPLLAGLREIAGAEEVLGLPELAGAALAKFIKAASADEELEILGGGADAVEEVGEGGEGAGGAGLNEGCGGAFGEAFGAGERDADGRAVGNEGGAGFVDGGGEEAKAEAMALEDVDEGSVKAFAIGEDGGHEFGGVVAFEPGGFVGFHAVGGAVGFAEGVAGEAGDEVPDLGNFFG